MELSDSLILYDSIVFFVGLFLAFVYLYYIVRKFNFDYNVVALFILYVICSYSSYNIMVMPIHDYNLPVARNFIYHYKVFSIFSITDIVFFALSAFIIIRCATNFGEFKSFKKNESVIRFIIAIVIVQGIVVAVLSTAGFSYHVTHDGVGQLKRQFMYFRGVIYFFVLAYFFYHSLKRLSPLGFYRVMAFFCILDLVNFTSGLVSSSIYYDFLWERYGVKVTIIDQDKIYNYFTIYSLMIFAFVFSRTPKKFAVCFATIVIGAVMYFNVYKFLFAIAILFVLYDIFINILSKKISKLKIAVVFLAGIMALPAVINLYSSKSMNTRSSQLSDYWEYTGKYFPANVIGIGYGGLYYSPTGVADKGESKKIDLEKLGEHYKRSIQTPLLTQLKNSGTLGLLFMLCIAILVSVKMTRVNLALSDNVFSNAICFNIIWLVGSSCILLQPYPMPSLTFVKLLLLLLLLLNEYKQKNGTIDEIKSVGDMGSDRT
jgi:hypothetical protein